jgi:hypothetical protein
VRLFKDLLGNEWEVVVGRESWGTVVAIFVLRGSSEPPRQAIIDVSSWDDGNRRLQEMTDDDLRDLLGASEKKSMG